MTKDERAYLMQLMSTIPGELAEQAQGLRLVAECLRREVLFTEGNLKRLQTNIQALLERVTELERRVGGLCNTAQKAVSIGPLMDMQRKREDDDDEVVS